VRAGIVFGFSFVAHCGAAQPLLLADRSGQKAMRDYALHAWLLGGLWRAVDAAGGLCWGPF